MLHNQMNDQEARYKAVKLAKEKYADRLRYHITAVRKYGEQIGVSKDQLLNHDASKWLKAEFEPYALHFHSDLDYADEFAKAWLHHLHNNPHHWNHWVFPEYFTPKGSNVVNGAVPMPRRYVMEMIADWMAMEDEISGHSDITEWVRANLPRFNIHPMSKEFLLTQLHKLGFKA